MASGEHPASLPFYIQDSTKVTPQDGQHCSKSSTVATRIYNYHSLSFEDTESLVTADDVSSSMFTEDVLTGIEAPEVVKKMATECRSTTFTGVEVGTVRRICRWFENIHLRGDSSQMDEDWRKMER